MPDAHKFGYNIIHISLRNKKNRIFIYYNGEAVGVTGNVADEKDQEEFIQTAIDMLRMRLHKR